MKEDLYNKIQGEPQDSLVMCPWKKCKERGEYIRCYFDIHEFCPKYQNHLELVRDIKNMQERRVSYKKREKKRHRYSRPDENDF